LSSEPVVPQTRGDHVWVGAIRSQDVGPYRIAVEQSRERISRWNPVDPEDLERQLAVQSRDRRTFLIHAIHPEGDHDIVGKVNVTDVVRGRFESAAIGYDSYDPYAGRGLFAEGLRLVVNLAFAPEADGGMGLHRVAAAVQPGNMPSAGLLRSLGFQNEGFAPRMLWLPGADGNHAWRDHVSYVVRAEEWPAEPYGAARGPKVVVLVNGAPGSGKDALARKLAFELRIPYLSEEVIKAGPTGALWALLGNFPVGAVVEGWFGPVDVERVVDGLRRCGFDPAAVLEVWCFSAERLSPTGPLRLGPVVAVDTGQHLDPGDIVRIALQVPSSGSSPACET
jgi:[ribosomal protein S5]-alanine N-acetyltransferase